MILLTIACFSKAIALARTVFFDFGDRLISQTLFYERCHHIELEAGNYRNLV